MANQARSGIFGWYFGTSLLLRIVIGLVLGFLVGLILATQFPQNTEGFVRYTKFFGDVFISLLKMIVVPTIFISLIAGSASITPAQLGKVGVKTLFFYLLTSAIAIVIGLALANIFQPGLNANMVFETEAAGKAAQKLVFTDVLLKIIPTNPFRALTTDDILPVIFFALLFGIALAVLRDSKDKTIADYADTFYHMITVGAEVMYKIVRGVMEYAPIGIFVLISNVLAIQGPKVMGPLFFTLFLCYIGFVLHLFIGYGSVLAMFRLSIFKFLDGVKEASITAFVTRSSSATLPISMRLAEERLGVPKKITSFALPIGATVNMDGTAIYLSIGAMFIANAVGKPLGFSEQVILFFIATLGAIGAAGVPGAGGLMMLMVLEAVGLPVEPGTLVASYYGLILAVDALFDMGRTGMNVTGDLVGVAVVGASEGEIDRSKWE